MGKHSQGLTTYFTSQLEADVYVEKAASCLKENNFKKALDLCIEGLQSYPDDTFLMTSAGVALCSLGKYRDAEDYFYRVATLSPFDPQAQYNMALCLFAQGSVRQTDEMLQFFERALKIDPENYSCRTDYGIALKETGSPKAAKEEFLKVLKDKPLYARAHSNYGIIRYEEGSRDKITERHLQFAWERDHNFYQAGYALALLHVRNGKTNKAVTVGDAAARSARYYGDFETAQKLYDLLPQLPKEYGPPAEAPYTINVPFLTV